MPTAIRGSAGKVVSANKERDLVERICGLLDENKTPEEIKEILAEELAVEPMNAGIIRTRKGALMVRVSDDRWPIAMYKKDWQILLNKVPAIKAALNELDIADENPEPSQKVKNLQQEERAA